MVIGGVSHMNEFQEIGVFWRKYLVTTKEELHIIVLYVVFIINDASLNIEYGEKDKEGYLKNVKKQKIPVADEKAALQLRLL